MLTHMPALLLRLHQVIELRRFVRSIILVLALAAVSTLPAAIAAEQALIANTSVAQDALSLNTTRLIFSMLLDRWPSGDGVRVFVLPDDNPAHRAFSKDLLHLYPRQLRRVWDRQLYSGTGQAPETVETQEEMRRRVAETPGAIGYLSRPMIDETVHELPLR